MNPASETTLSLGLFVCTDTETSPGVSIFNESARIISRTLHASYGKKIGITRSDICLVSPIQNIAPLIFVMSVCFSTALH